MSIYDKRYTTWNAELLRLAKYFATDASKASIFVVSSYVINSGDPETYGLPMTIEEEDSNSKNDDRDAESHDDNDDGQMAMSVDYIHLSTAGHQAFKSANKLYVIVI